MNRGESLVMQRDISDTQTVSFGFYATSRHCIPSLSPRNSNLNEVTANNGAQENCSGRQRAARLLRGGLCGGAAGVTRAAAVSELEFVRRLVVS